MPFEVYLTWRLRYCNMANVRNLPQKHQVMDIQSNSPVDFRTLPVDCRNFLALTAVLLCLLCVVVAKKQCEQILATIHIRHYGTGVALK